MGNSRKVSGSFTSCKRKNRKLNENNGVYGYMAKLIFCKSSTPSST